MIERLLDPDFYDHPAAAVEQIETHISRIFLAGDYAYKLKKPLDLGFLDFSTREKRRHFCHEELRLNRRFAPQLYLEVCRIGGPPELPRLGGEPPLDYLVKMKRFPDRAQLDRMLADGQLGGDLLEAFADRIAELHREAAVADPASDFGSVAAVLDPVRENFTQLAPILPDAETVELYRELERWSVNAGEALRDRLQQRKRDGFIRECHGDIHLANMVWWRGRPLLFDCIEFNANLRWIDLFNDVGFLVMDLDDRGETSLGWQFLNRYLQQSGDYRGVDLLDFYLVYRAVVRAKVACLRLVQPGIKAADKARERQLTHSYLELASRYIRPRRPQLTIAHGLSGSGKTSFVNRLAAACGAIRIHSDIERKRLAGLEAGDSSRSPLGGGIYGADATRETYRRLAELAEALLRARYSVILDATFLRQQQRERMRRLADSLRVPMRILDFPVAEAELRRRIALRVRQPGLVSEATGAVLDRQLAEQDPLTDAELQAVIRIDPTTPVRQVAAELAQARPG